MTKDFQIVPIEQCVALEEFNARRKGVGDITELAASIEAVGILQPILGHKTDKGLEVEIHAGFRRLAAAEKVGLKEVPVIITPKKRITKKQMFIVNVSENLQREDLNPVDEAYAFERLQTEHKMSIDDIALELGVKKTRVSSRFKMLKLSVALIDSIQSGRITIKAAFEINRLPADKESKYIAVAESLSGPKLATMVDKELEKLSKQTGIEKTKVKEEPVADNTEFLRQIKTCSSVFANVLNYDDEERQELRNVDYSPLEIDGLKTVAKLFDSVADALPEDIEINDKARLEIETKVAEGIGSIDLEKECIRDALVEGVTNRAAAIAEEKTTAGRRPKVTFVHAKQAIEEFLSK